MLGAAKDVLKESIFAQRMYRRYVQQYLPRLEPEEFLLESMTFDQSVDVGANVGIYTTLLSRNCNLVYAFEPVKRSFEILRGLRLRNVVAYNTALGSENGEVEIALPMYEGKPDYGTATLRPISQNEYHALERQKVRVQKFDNLEGEIDFQRIDFVKIDVEGFERQVLLGMQRLMELRKAVFMIEIEQRHNPHYIEVFQYLRELGYVPYFTTDGVALNSLNTLDIPSLQSAGNFAHDLGRKFRRGDKKTYINNVFFLQQTHKGRYRFV